MSSSILTSRMQSQRLQASNCARASIYSTARTNFISVMPTNLYGHNDNYDLKNLTYCRQWFARCIFRNFWRMAITQKLPKTLTYRRLPILCYPWTRAVWYYKPKQGVNLGLWGTGTPMREFMHSDDMAEACVYVMNKVTRPQGWFVPVRNTHINLGTGIDQTIAEIAHVIKDIVGFDGSLSWQH